AKQLTISVIEQCCFVIKQCCFVIKQCCFVIKQCHSPRERTVFAAKQSVRGKPMTIPASELRVSVAKIICDEPDTVMFATKSICIVPKAVFLKGKIATRNLARTIGISSGC